jgi:hypothetical protein
MGGANLPHQQCPSRNNDCSDHLGGADDPKRNDLSSLDTSNNRWQMLPIADHCRGGNGKYHPEHRQSADHGGKPQNLSQFIPPRGPHDPSPL